MKTYFRIWLIAVLLIGCVRLLQGQTMKDGVSVVQVENWSPYAVAQTNCTADNQPIILMRKMDWDSLEYRLTMTHELIHVRQMKADCKKVQRAYRDSLAVRIRMETEAYCEDSRERLKAGQNPKWIKERFYNILLGLYGIEDPACPYLPP